MYIAGSTSETPERISLAHESQELIARAIMGLNTTQREAVSMIFFEGVENEKAAGILGLSRAELDEQLKQAYGLLNKKLKGLL